VVARLSFDSTVRLAVTGPGGTVYSSAVASSGRVARLEIAGLTADTDYTYVVESTIDASTCEEGAFTTLPTTAGNAADFTIALAGDAASGSNASAFDAIRASSPLFFIHLGDLHYDDIGTNSQTLFHAAYDEVFRSSRQARLYREVPTVYVWDDHDYGANNSDGTSASKPAAAAVYRSRVPHYPLEEATGIYHSFDVGRVRFIVTDQRSAASPNSDTDNSSKTMLGATQKAWFKNLLQNSPGMLVVWVCPRHFASGTVAGHDSWGGFSTERAELGAHVAANCPGRVIVLSADAHVLGIDDGSNRTFGGNAFPTFQAAPLDQGSSFPGDTFSEGGFGGNGQWGRMAIADSGGATIGVTWTGHDSTGATLVTYSFSVAV
jgi:phosphodiesterase/alkaline phosphatase D-like protein